MKNVKYHRRAIEDERDKETATFKTKIDHSPKVRGSLILSLRHFLSKPSLSLSHSTEVRETKHRHDTRKIQKDTHKQENTEEPAAVFLFESHFYKIKKQFIVVSCFRPHVIVRWLNKPMCTQTLREYCD